MNKITNDTLSKVPAVTLGFWIIKVAATTLGETGGDAITMTLGLGYLIGTAMFAILLVAALTAQIRATRFQHSSIGRLSSLPRRLARRLPISATGRSASAMSVDRRSCLRC